MVRCRQKKRKDTSHFCVTYPAIPVKNGLAFQTYYTKKTRKVSRLIPGYSVAGRNFIHPRIPAVATRRDGGGNGDHDGDDDEAVVEDATIGFFGFFVVVPVFRFFYLSQGLLEYSFRESLSRCAQLPFECHYRDILPKRSISEN